MQELTKVLSLDPALAARILRISNSAAYSRGREITNLSQAIMTLGAKNISIIALGFSLKSAIPGWEHDSGISDTTFWRQNVATAVAARGLSRLVRMPDHEQAFLCGLLSRIGQLLLYSVAPQEYGEVLSRTNGRLPSASEETELLGISHHEAAGRLLSCWQLPTFIQETVANWGGVDASEAKSAVSAEVQRAAAVVTVADAFATMIFGEEKALGLQQVHSIASAQLGVSGDEADRLFKSCGQDIQETLAIFEIPHNEPIDCERILEQARQQLVNVSLTLMADLNAARTSTNSLLEENRQLAEQSSRDPLTGLANRLTLDRELESLQAARSQSAGSPAYSIMMIDVDHFKSFNDTYGHKVGDDVLKAVAGVLSYSARATDLVARYGGEEFVVVLTNAGRAEAAQVAERFRQAIERQKVELDDRTLSVTASIGIASSDSLPPGSGYHDVMAHADASLYEAKRGGRNRVVVFQASNESAVR
jgi:diguanylate cyclase (GGDEF)-like protein